MKIFSLISDFLKSQDTFGTQISLMYKGSSTYRSNLGGFLSLASRVFFVVYFAYHIKSVVWREDHVVNQTIKKKDLTKAPLITLNEENFGIAMRVDVNID